MNKARVRSRRSGMAFIYIIVALVAMLGFCSFAVDLGRVQTAKTELRRAADAAARGGREHSAGDHGGAERRHCHRCTE